VYAVEAVDCSFANQVLTKGVLPPSVEKNKRRSKLAQNDDQMADDNAATKSATNDNDDLMADIEAQEKLAKETAKALETETENAKHADILKKSIADGIGTAMNFEAARRLVGRYKVAQYVHFLTHPRPMFPLCIRSYKFTHADAR
jgi:hypothetical protein